MLVNDVPFSSFMVIKINMKRDLQMNNREWLFTEVDLQLWATQVK